MNENKVFEFNSLIQSGADSNHLFVFLTTKKMINLLQFTNLAAYFIDCTYDINHNSFPILNFGL